MLDLMKIVREKAKKARKRICIAEAEDERVLRAVDALVKEKIMDIVLIGNEKKIREHAKEFQTNLGNSEIIDIQSYKDKDILVDEIYGLRKHKGLSRQQAKKLLEDYNYFGCMLLHLGKVDAFCSSCVCSTAELMRPGLQIIKTREGISTASEIMVFIDRKKNRVFFTSDGSIVIEPTAEQLADIAMNAADVCSAFGFSPKVAMLSYSTHGSGERPILEPIREAIRIVREKKPELIVDGEIQFDAATNPASAKRKCHKGDVLKGQANVLIFPNLSAANILGHAWIQLGVPEYQFGISAGMRKPIVIYGRSSTWQIIKNLTILAQMEANAF